MQITILCLTDCSKGVCVSCYSVIQKDSKGYHIVSEGDSEMSIFYPLLFLRDWTFQIWEKWSRVPWPVHAVVPQP